MKKLSLFTTLFILVVCACARGAGTASGTVITSSTSMSVYNAATSTTMTTAANNNTVIAVYGFATSTYAEEAGKPSIAGGTVNYDFTIANNGNAADNIKLNVGAQNFGGLAGPTAEWSVAADNVGVGALTFTTSGTATASQAGDTAAAAGVAPGATVTFRVYHTTSGSASDSAASSFTVGFQTTNFPGAPYTGFNGNTYAGPTLWSRQLDGGLLITTVNGVQVAATKTLTIAAPAAYVTAGGGAADPIPGSTINVLVQFTNSGSTPAAGVVIRDDIPTDTTFTAGSIQSCFTGSACIPAADPDANGGDPDCYYTPGAPAYIRCDMATMNAAGGGVLRYSVTIN